MSAYRVTAAMAAALVSAALGPVAARAADNPVLAELFTSLACSSCPPADSVLGDLAGRPDVLALSFHVDYWDGLGWKDPYSLRLATVRQRHYALTLGADTYTPQLVVDGRSETVGSERGNVESLMRQPRRQLTSASIHADGSVFKVTIGGSATPASANILLVTFDPVHQTPVRGGENGGRLLETFNDVRSLRPIGEWRGEPVTLDLPRTETEIGERAAIIVQSDDGTVWALAATPARAS